MSALLGEPFLLVNYPTASQSFPELGEGPKGKGISHASVTYSGSEHGEGFVTVSVQGDGIHVLELSNLHPKLSHTLGPSTIFAAPVVTRFDNSDLSTSYAVMQSSAEGIGKHDCRRTIWMWRDCLSKRPEKLSESKRSVVFPRLIERIYAPPELPSHIIAISPSGDVMLADADLSIVATNVVANSSSTLVRSWILKVEDCVFLPHRTHASSPVVVICFVSEESKLKARIILAKATSKLELVAECDLEVERNIIDISCDPSGHTTVLCQGGQWYFFRFIQDPTGTISVKSLDKTLRLGALTFSSSEKHSDNSMCCPSIISVGSSFVLLSCISVGPSPELVLLLWDVQYSIVLSSQKCTLPPTLSYNPKIPPTLELVPASKSQALLVLSPSVNSTGKTNRSTILIVPLALPPTSTIALAMGKAHDTQKWLNTQHTHKRSGTEQGNRHLIETVRQSMMDNVPEEAEQAFFGWLERETANASPDEQIDAKLPESSAHKSNKSKKPSKAHFSHHFVSNILDAVLQPSRSTASYTPKIVQYLISQEVVGHSMVEGGLFAALRQRGDWDSVAFALQKVHDLPESDVLRLLADIVKIHRQVHQSNGDEMMIDAPSGMPSLSRYLSMLIVYSMTTPMVLIALKTHFSDARDIMCILEVLEGWLSSWSDINTGYNILDATINSNQSGESGREERPSLQPIIIFLQSVLDAHFLTLLQYAPSYAIMEQITQHLDEQLASVEGLDCLQGPLEVFVRAEAQKARNQNSEKENNKDVRKSQREAAEARELAIGLYQMEELVL